MGWLKSPAATGISSTFFKAIIQLRQHPWRLMRWQDGVTMLHMGAQVDEQVAHAMRALIESDSTLAEQVIEHDSHINQMEVQIDEHILLLLARRQPAK